MKIDEKKYFAEYFVAKNYGKIQKQFKKRGVSEQIEQNTPGGLLQKKKGFSKMLYNKFYATHRTFPRLFVFNHSQDG